MSRDWLQWHHEYDTPNSPLTGRLAVVHRNLRQALVEAPRGADGRQCLISICAGEGRDVLPVLAEHDDGRGMLTFLIELDPTLAQRARSTAERLGLSGVEVLIADAGNTDAYLGLPPAHVLLVCGVFGNLTAQDVRRTVATLPALLAVGGMVIWTRAGRDPSLAVRDCFTDNGFVEVSFTSTVDDRFRVGTHQLAADLAGVRSLEPGTRVFTFR